MIQLVYKVHDIKIPRDVSQQAEVGVSLTFMEEAQAGDLAFFENEEGTIIYIRNDSEQSEHYPCFRKSKNRHLGFHRNF